MMTDAVAHKDLAEEKSETTQSPAVQEECGNALTRYIVKTCEKLRENPVYKWAYYLSILIEYTEYSVFVYVNAVWAIYSQVYGSHGFEMCISYSCIYIPYIMLCI